ncbi:hypothetical protein [Aristophania vespae]|nr:hypothetical protein [Aristophania vespae]UMM63079.1 hypothetical protein DM15PD_00330 [Aristophania vespae]
MSSYIEDKPKGRFRLIFRAWKRNPKTGERMYAKAYGYRGWPIWIEVE